MKHKKKQKRISCLSYALLERKREKDFPLVFCCSESVFILLLLLLLVKSLKTLKIFFFLAKKREKQDDTKVIFSFTVILLLFLLYLAMLFLLLLLTPLLKFSIFQVVCYTFYDCQNVYLFMIRIWLSHMSITSLCLFCSLFC